jgi:hypothetical protein
MLGGKREQVDVKAVFDDLKADEMQRRQDELDQRQRRLEDVGFKPKKK